MKILYYTQAGILTDTSLGFVACFRSFCILKSIFGFAVVSSNLVFNLFIKYIKKLNSLQIQIDKRCALYYNSFVVIQHILESWLSGLRRTTGNRVEAETSLGFKSLTLRQSVTGTRYDLAIAHRALYTVGIVLPFASTIYQCAKNRNPPRASDTNVTLAQNAPLEAADVPLPTNPHAPAPCKAATPLFCGKNHYAPPLSISQVAAT